MTSSWLLCFLALIMMHRPMPADRSRATVCARRWRARGAARRTGGVVGRVPGGQADRFRQAVDVKRIVPPQAPQGRDRRERLMAAPRRRLLRLGVDVREERLAARSARVRTK